MAKNQPKARRRARAAAAAAARRRKQRIRVGLLAGVVVLAIVAIAAAVFMGDDEEEEATPTTTGQRCVARTGELPEGAPDVPVKEGPPPAELLIEDLKVGDGEEVAEGASVTIHYIGVACSTGAIFDSSYSTGAPATFSLSGLIPGWQQGIPGMKVGGQRLLGIPPELAYGPEPQPPHIGANETLWFVVDVVGTAPAETAPPPPG